MKILHFKSTFLNPSETFIDRLIRNQQRYQPIVACLNKRAFCDGLQVFQPTPESMRHRLESAMLKLNRTPSFLFDLAARHRPRVIHAHFGLEGYRLLPLSRTTGIPLVVSFYGSDVTRLPFEFGWRRRYRILAERGDAFIACSQKMKRQLIALGFPETKIHVVYFGVELEQFSYRESWEATGRLMMIGRMVEKKGFETAIRAVRRLVRSRTDVQLNLYGDGPLAAPLRRLVSELQVERHVTFNGFISNRDVPSLLRQHDMLLVPSQRAADGDTEGLPNTVIEGMTSGIPVVGSRHAAIPEVIQNRKTGMLIDEKRDDQLAGAIQKILESPDLAENIRREARAFIVQKGFTVDSMVERVDGIYDMVGARW